MFHINSNTVSYFIYKEARDDYKQKTNFYCYSNNRTPVRDALRMQRKILPVIATQKWGLA